MRWIYGGRVCARAAKGHKWTFRISRPILCPDDLGTVCAGAGPRPRSSACAASLSAETGALRGSSPLRWIAPASPQSRTHCAWARAGAKRRCSRRTMTSRSRGHQLFNGGGELAHPERSVVDGDAALGGGYHLGAQEGFVGGVGHRQTFPLALTSRMCAASSSEIGGLHSVTPFLL